MSKRKRRNKRPTESPIRIDAAAIARAEREAARNKARVEAGETYASRKPSAWRRGGRRSD